MIDRQRQSLSMVPVRRMSGKIEMREALCNRRCVCCVCVCVCEWRGCVLKREH
jgi:hypothetical protein